MCLPDFFHAWSLIVSVQNFHYKCYMNMFLTYMNFIMHLHWLWLCKLFEYLLQIDLFLHDFFHASSLIVSVPNLYYNYHMNMFLTCMNFLMNLHWWLYINFFNTYHKFICSFMIFSWIITDCECASENFIRKFIKVKNIFMWQL